MGVAIGSLMDHFFLSQAHTLARNQHFACPLPTFQFLVAAWLIYITSGCQKTFSATKFFD